MANLALNLCAPSPALKPSSVNQYYSSISSAKQLYTPDLISKAAAAGILISKQTQRKKFTRIRGRKSHIMLLCRKINYQNQRNPLRLSYWSDEIELPTTNNTVFVRWVDSKEKFLGGK